MDQHRQALTGFGLTQHSNFLIAAGLHSQAASWLAKIGLNEYVSDKS